jgi:Aerotolerance regulator N-terminal/von Willebrand factor type A domain
MSFVHPLLLGGLLLVGIPVLIHLIMRQKPKHLLFPAFRFLQQKHRTTQTKLRLRHLLLLALRILLIVAVCLALARPRLFTEGFLNLSTDSKAAVVLVFDTSMSMEYTVNQRTRLDEAKQRAHELIDELAEGSRIAVLDSGQPGSGEWATSRTDAASRIDKLVLRPANAPVTRQLGQAYHLLEDLAQTEEAGEQVPRILYLFSDRTAESWDDNEAHSLTKPDNVTAVYVDLGEEKPADLAITNLRLERQVLAPGEKLEVTVTVQATGADFDTVLTCSIDAEAAGDQRPVKLQAGQQAAVTFERTADWAAGPHRFEVRLAAPDALPFDDFRFGTFLVRDRRRILTLVDNADDAKFWARALDVAERYRTTVRQAGESAGLDPQQLRTQYEAVCLFGVKAPDDRLWGMLKAYLDKGGALIVVPGQALEKAAYNSEAAHDVLPGEFKRLIETDSKEPEVPWLWDEAAAHPFVAPFLLWKKTADVDFFRPEKLARATRYWSVDPGAEERVIVHYADDQKRPAVLERGKVLLFTTGFDGHRDDQGRPYWNNYLQSSFHLVLVNKAVGYLTGESTDPNVNLICGQTVLLPPSDAPPVQYQLGGPGLAGASVSLSWPPGGKPLEISPDVAAAPGNFVLSGTKDGRAVAGFSLNVRWEECNLTQVDSARIEGVFGPGSVVSASRATSWHKALEGRRQPIEAMPALLLLLLLALAVENLLANKFYRNPGQPSAPEPALTAQERRHVWVHGALWLLGGLLGGALVGALLGILLLGLVAGAVVGVVLALGVNPRGRSAS